MPHGGPRVRTRLAERLRELGAEPEPAPPAAALYPEASTELEAEMLHTLARAASPAAIDPLLAQPRRWAEALTAGGAAGTAEDSASEEPGPAGLDREAIRRQSDRLDRLVDPPTVVLLGRANVGKSTLANAVVGRAASITADLPGTTRDWVAGLAELPVPLGDLAVRWFDTPGLRRTEDPIERRAVELAGELTRTADLLLAIAEPATDPEAGAGPAEAPTSSAAEPAPRWPDTGDLPRRPDLYVLNKADLLAAPSPGTGDTPDDPLPLSARHGEGLDRLAEAVARRLGLTDLEPSIPWAFSPALRELLDAGDPAALRRYALGRT